MRLLGINSSKTEGILRKLKKVIKFTQKNLKKMAPLESLSQYLSNEYQCYGVSMVLKLPIFLAF
jgi:hypothetical protein